MDLIDAIKPLFYVSRIFGLAPYKLTKTKQNKTQLEESRSVLLTSSVSSAFNIAFMLTASFLFATYSDISTNVSSIVDFNVLLQVFCANAIFLYSHFAANVQHDNNLANITRLARLTDTLGLTRKYYQTLKRKLMIGLTVFTIAFALSFLLEFVAWGLTLTLLPVAVVYFLSDSANTLSEFQFSNMADVLATCFAALDAKLKASYGTSVDSDARPTGRGITCIHPTEYLHAVIRRTGKTATKDTHPQSRKTRGDTFPVSELHSDLYEVVQQVNAQYGVENLLRITAFFLNLVQGLFYVAIHLLGLAGEPANSLLMPSIVFDSLLKLMRLMRVVYLGDAVKKQAESFAYTVSTLQTNARTAEQREQMQLLSLQLLHRRVAMTAADFFVIDATLLASIVSNATTYLVILIQFKQAGK